MRIHPGEYIRDEIESRGWTVATLATQSGLLPARLETLLAGRRALTLLDAQGLSVAFGTSREVWVNLQREFDAADVVG